MRSLEMPHTGSQSTPIGSLRLDSSAALSIAERSFFN